MNEKGISCITSLLNSQNKQGGWVNARQTAAFYLMSSVCDEPLWRVFSLNVSPVWIYCICGESIDGGMKIDFHQSLS